MQCTIWVPLIKSNKAVNFFLFFYIVDNCLYPILSVQMEIDSSGIISVSCVHDVISFPRIKDLFARAAGNNPREGRNGKVQRLCVHRTVRKPV